MVDNSPTSPRRQPWRSVATAAVATGAVGMLLFTVPISTQAQQPPEFDGGGTVVTDTPNKSTTPDNTPIAPPSKDNLPCAYFYDNAGESQADYRGRYSVTDNDGNVHTYDGPMKVTIGWTGTYEGPDGTFGPPTLVSVNNQNMAACRKPVGYKYPLTHASRAGSSEGKSISCTYQVGPAARSEFWRITTLEEVDKSEFVFNLFGTCELIDAGVKYGFETEEKRVAITVASMPGATKGMQGVSQVTWVETYKATTKCTLNCDPPPASPPASPPPDDGNEDDGDTGVEETTTTTTTIERTATTTTTRPATGPADAPPPGRSTLLAGPVQAPGSPPTPTGGLPSGLAGPATGGGGFAQAPAPVAGSAPSAATATAAGGAPAGSSAFVPSAAAAPGTAGAAARVAAPLPLIAAVPGADAAAQYNMVRHERPAIPAPVLAVAGGLWLMFVCAAGVRILNPRPEHEPEPVPAPAVGFPVDIEEESP